MIRISELLENLILIGYCLYRIFIGIHHIAQNVKFVSEKDFYGWIENHCWPEIEIAFAVMAIAGLLSSRRFVFCFTVFFFVLRSTIGITNVAMDLYILLSDKSISCITSEHFSPDLSPNCKWSDASLFIQDALTFVSLILMSIVVFLRLFYLMPIRNDYEHDPVKQNYFDRQQQLMKLPFIIKYDDDNPYKSSVI
uniref:Methylamine utilization protein MauE n=1 Tax=Elaeophora elaphi TaxID=1147741 RepID=A0A0R3RI56_9BILA